MSMILEKYKNKRKLGKGAYGDVLLVQDPNGRQMAIKMVSKKIIQKDPYLEQYLEGQKEVMMSVKNRHVVQLYAFEEDDNFKYFVCEYCDGGDLLNYQAKQPNKVFTLKQATEILSQVIRGLQMLHYKGYLHRDIKPANILLKKTNQPDKFEFKLADFGFAKKNSEVGGTVLGTEHYMSPEIFSNQIYSYEVDMWAFAVLFYFMLNMELPFRINPHASIESKQQDLIKQSTDFSYKETVQKSKKRLLNNCSSDVQDLFLRMFEPDGQKRITFLQIREHQLFKQFFPVIQSQSRILYKSKQINRYDSFVLQKQSNIQFNKNKPKKPTTNNVPQNSNQNETTANTINTIQDNAIPSLHITKANTSQQKSLLQAEYDKIVFLEQVSKEFLGSLDFIDSAQITALTYNLLKYHIILLRNFYGSLKPETLQKEHPGLKWKQHSKNPQFNTFKNRVRQKLDEAQLNISLCYDQCRNIAARIRNTNPQIQANLENQVTNKDFSGAFKLSYRSSTGYVYAILRQKLGNGNKFAYLTALIVMCHGFNNLIDCCDEQLEQLFPDFVKERKNKDHIQFIELKNWMSTSNKQKIKVIIKNILSTFFSG